MKQKEQYLSSYFCVLPQFITDKNMFDGYQYYQTTEHILGITTNKDSWEKVRCYNYNNSVFKGTLSFCHNHFYGQILTHANVDGKDYYSCNGLCEPERSTQILELYKKVKDHCKKEYFSQYDIEQYMFVELQKLSVTNPEIKS